MIAPCRNYAICPPGRLQNEVIVVWANGISRLSQHPRLSCFEREQIDYFSTLKTPYLRQLRTPSDGRVIGYFVSGRRIQHDEEHGSRSSDTQVLPPQQIAICAVIVKDSPGFFRTPRNAIRFVHSRIHIRSLSTHSYDYASTAQSQFHKTVAGSFGVDSFDMFSGSTSIAASGVRRRTRF